MRRPNPEPGAAPRAGARGARLGIAAGLWAVALAAAAGPDAAALLFGMERASAAVGDYTAIFRRQERVGGELRDPETVQLKYQEPGRIYMRWITGPTPGRELLFVPGRDQDRVLIHEPGWLSGAFTVVTAPDGPLILGESRHPVTDVGIGRLAALILDSARRARQAGDLRVTDRGADRIGGRPARQLELTLPHDAPGRYCCARALVAVDASRGVPLAARLFDRDGRLLARYEYTDLRVDPGLAPLDFDPANPAYGFPRWRLRR